MDPMGRAIGRWATAALTVFAAVPGSAGAQATVVAAGDIACATTAAGFNAGLGTFGPDARCHQKYTSDVLAALRPAVVLALRAPQYGTGAVSDFLASHHRSEPAGGPDRVGGRQGGPAAGHNGRAVA